jgi:uncharacterized membrane protein
LKRLGELARVTIMEQLLKNLASHVALAVEAVAVLVIAAGSLEAFIGLLGVGVGKRATHGARKAVWQRYGVWLLLGLEFELAADIIRSVISPTWLDIGQLGAIAVIRTFLNYFLEKDFESAGRAESTPFPSVADTRGHMA